MQSLDLNLASRPFRNNTLLWLGYGLAVVLLVAFTVWNVDTWREHRAWLADLQQQTGDFESQRTELELRDSRALRGIDQYDLGSLEVQVDKANEVIRWKSFSWTRLFNLLEEIQPWEVRMTSINPVFRAERSRGRNDGAALDEDAVPVTVEGVAKDLQAFLEFERALIYDPHFDRVQPERTGKDEVTGETVFSLRFIYDPTAGEVDPAQLETAEAETEGAPEDTPEEAATAEAGEAADGAPPVEPAGDAPGPPPADPGPEADAVAEGGAAAGAGAGLPRSPDGQGPTARSRQ